MVHLSSRHRQPRAVRSRVALGAATGVVALLLAGCAQPGSSATIAASGSSTGQPTSGAPAAEAVPGGAGSSVSIGPYAATGAGALTGNATKARRLVYVPNQRGGTVQVIDPTTYKVIDRFKVATSPEHVVPNHDMSTLWVNSDAGNALTPIDPLTGKAGAAVPVEDPYNLYFTPKGDSALVMAERLRRVDVRDASTMQLQRSVPVPCYGLNHADFSQDLSTMVASCEFDGQLVVFDKGMTTVVKTIDLNSTATPGATDPDRARRMGGPSKQLRLGASSMPQDVRLSPDGSSFLVADMMRNGIWVVNAESLTIDRFVPTGKGAHGIYPSRDASSVYVSNRDEGTVSVLDAKTLTQTALWRIPGGGSPDMGGVTEDGKELWLSGRYSNAVYVFDTATGAVTHTIPVDGGPHGLLVWPQPGRFSLGHTGNMR
ncbi:MAG: hypothetical protein M3Z83_01825 [Actinomycetota bacterium]|nr:hypothetical protein [Actinomycetota bacterium]